MVDRKYPKNWRKLADECKAVAGYVCKHCGSNKGRMEAAHLDHDYDNDNPRLGCLCHKCHFRYDEIHRAWTAIETIAGRPHDLSASARRMLVAYMLQLRSGGCQIDESDVSSDAFVELATAGIISPRQVVCVQHYAEVDDYARDLIVTCLSSKHGLGVLDLWMKGFC